MVYLLYAYNDKKKKKDIVLLLTVWEQYNAIKFIVNNLIKKR